MNERTEPRTEMKVEIFISIVVKEILFQLGMGSSKSLKIPAFMKKSDLLLLFSSLLIGLNRREFSNF